MKHSRERGIWHAAKDLRSGLEPGSAAYMACALTTWPPARPELHFLCLATVTPSTALIVAGILFIMAPNKGESAVFKCSISSTTYRQTNFFNSLQQKLDFPHLLQQVSGRSPTEVEDVALFAALCLTPPGGTCSVNLTLLPLQMFLQIWCLCFWSFSRISLLPPLLFVFVSLRGVTR